MFIVVYQTSDYYKMDGELIVFLLRSRISKSLLRVCIGRAKHCKNVQRRVRTGLTIGQNGRMPWASRFWGPRASIPKHFLLFFLFSGCSPRVKKL